MATKTTLNIQNISSTNEMLQLYKDLNINIYRTRETSSNLKSPNVEIYTLSLSLVAAAVSKPVFNN